MSAIRADYRTTKHVPSRKCYQLVMEVPEEDFPSVCQVLGYPRTGENTYVGIALLDKSVIRENGTTEQRVNNAQSNSPEKPDSSESDKLRVRAVMLAKENDFQQFLKDVYFSAPSEIAARNTMCNICHIESRSELATNEAAQARFAELLVRFHSWKIEQQYPDNIWRM